ncbi:unnamed protein product [Amoebophrya sp. A120]|nr:unnamed protein product [Amoebophrya sp. A120]|eukprot:GSA120T00017094001.1
MHRAQEERDQEKAALLELEDKVEQTEKLLKQTEKKEKKLLEENAKKDVRDVKKLQEDFKVPDPVLKCLLQTRMCLQAGHHKCWSKPPPADEQHGGQGANPAAGTEDVEGDGEGINTASSKPPELIVLESEEIDDFASCRKTARVIDLDEGASDEERQREKQDKQGAAQKRSGSERNKDDTTIGAGGCTKSASTSRPAAGSSSSSSSAPGINQTNTANAASSTGASTLGGTGATSSSSSRPAVMQHEELLQPAPDTNQNIVNKTAVPPHAQPFVLDISDFYPFRDQSESLLPEKTSGWPQAETTRFYQVMRKDDDERRRVRRELTAGRKRYNFKRKRAAEHEQECIGVENEIAALEAELGKLDDELCVTKYEKELASKNVDPDRGPAREAEKLFSPSPAPRVRKQEKRQLLGAAGITTGAGVGTSQVRNRELKAVPSSPLELPSSSSRGFVGGTKTGVRGESDLLRGPQLQDEPQAKRRKILQDAVTSTGTSGNAVGSNSNSSSRKRDAAGLIVIDETASRDAMVMDVAKSRERKVRPPAGLRSRWAHSRPPAPAAVDENHFGLHQSLLPNDPRPDDATVGVVEIKEAVTATRSAANYAEQTDHDASSNPPFEAMNSNEPAPSGAPSSRKGPAMSTSLATGVDDVHPSIFTGAAPTSSSAGGNKQIENVTSPGLSHGLERQHHRNKTGTDEAGLFDGPEKAVPSPVRSIAGRSAPAAKGPELEHLKRQKVMSSSSTSSAAAPQDKLQGLPSTSAAASSAMAPPVLELGDKKRPVVHLEAAANSTDGKGGLPPVLTGPQPGTSRTGSALVRGAASSEILPSSTSSSSMNTTASTRGTNKGKNKMKRPAENYSSDEEKNQSQKPGMLGAATSRGGKKGSAGTFRPRVNLNLLGGTTGVGSGRGNYNSGGAQSAAAVWLYTEKWRCFVAMRFMIMMIFFIRMKLKLSCRSHTGDNYRR